MSIVEWPANDRPRERLLAQGADALSDAELLAIFFRTGVVGKSAVDLSRELLVATGGLRALLDLSEAQFCHFKGVGSAKYVQLQAALEMGRRYLKMSLEKGDALGSASVAVQFLQSKLRHLDREHFVALYLDSQNQLIEYVELAIGTIDSATVYPREVVKSALHFNAVAVIFAHNHPSGRSQPSHSDKELTNSLVQALKTVDIRVFDHIVIGDGEHFSFAEHGWL